MKIFEGLFDLATLPLDIIKDAATLGGTITNEESAIKKKCKKLDKDLKDD